MVRSGTASELRLSRPPSCNSGTSRKVVLIGKPAVSLISERVGQGRVSNALRMSRTRPATDFGAPGRVADQEWSSSDRCDPVPRPRVSWSTPSR
jgi:hypothetical protein